MNCTDYPSWYDEIDNSMCEHCNKDNDCWIAGRCLMEDYE